MHPPTWPAVALPGSAWVCPYISCSQGLSLHFLQPSWHVSACFAEGVPSWAIGMPHLRLLTARASQGAARPACPHACRRRAQGGWLARTPTRFTLGSCAHWPAALRPGGRQQPRLPAHGRQGAGRRRVFAAQRGGAAPGRPRRRRRRLVAAGPGAAAPPGMQPLHAAARCERCVRAQLGPAGAPLLGLFSPSPAWPVTCILRINFHVASMIAGSGAIRADIPVRSTCPHYSCVKHDEASTACVGASCQHARSQGRTLPRMALACARFAALRLARVELLWPVRRVVRSRAARG